jgi:hypothetical protein
MENAVIGVFDDFQHARDAGDALVQAGFREWAVQITPKEETHAARETAVDDHARYSSSEGWSIGNFFRTLFGLDADHEHAHVYAEALRRGSFLVTVEAEGEGPIEQAREIMGQFHPIDMQERATHWRSQGWSRFDATSKPYTADQIQSERSAYQTMTGGGQRGNANVQSFSRMGQGASPGGGSEIDGTTGTTGNAGTMGTTGTSGITGSAGTTGTSGAAGISGLGDAARTTGIAGSGIAGASGATESGADTGSGLTGANRTAGTGLGGAGTGMSSATGMSSTNGMSSAADDAASGLSGDLTGTRALGADAAPAADQATGHRYQAAAAVGGGAGFGATSGSALHQADTSRPTGSGGTLGSLGAGNADLHESAGASLGAGDATDRIREEVLGGEEQGRDTMGGDRPGIVHEAMGAGGISGDAASAGPNTSQYSQRMYDARAEVEEDTTSGVMGNAAMRDSTAPDIYTVDHDADYRTHWQKAYHMEGRYEDFQPAYRFGADLHHNDSLKNHHNWNEIEPEARRHWEAGSAGSNWEQAKDAVRHAWERMKDR